MLPPGEAIKETAGKVWPAPAKLNLFLHVTGRRADGYHDLQTLFQILDWGDELSFEINASGHVGRCGNIAGVPEQEDICVRAAHLLKSRCGVTQGVQITLNKRIPMGAGLGGGSSDAATVLSVLNRLWSCGLSRRQLAELGLELGADVPVFVNGYSAWAEGRGEKLQAVTLGPRHYVLVFPEVSISTAEIFAHPSLKRDSEPVEMSPDRLRPGRNDCTPVVLHLYPELRRLVEELSAWGEPQMSGTGSTFFLSFDTKKNAIEAASELECRYNVRPVSGVDRSDLLRNLSAEL
jgi:4-diphosphocytidyl-2-C-methyl-D-erythritol kinase